MKLKMTEDFKRASKGMIIYVITATVVFPIFHLIKGDFSWGDTLINAGLNVAIGIVLGVFFFFGFQIPEKDNK